MHQEEFRKRSTIVSCEILIFAKPCPNMIEMKKFVSNGTILQNKIQTKLVDLSQEVWEHWTIEKSFWLQPSVVYIKPFTSRIWRNDHSDRCRIGSTRNGTRHRVPPPVGGNGVDPGDLPKNSKKVDERGRMQRFMIERWNPLCSIFG